MARPRKLIPNYSRHRASGQAVVTINGRDIYLGPYGSAASKAAYDRIIGEWIAGGRMLIEGAGGISIARLMGVRSANPTFNRGAGHPKL